MIRKQQHSTRRLATASLGVWMLVSGCATQNGRMPTVLRQASKLDQKVAETKEPAGIVVPEPLPPDEATAQVAATRSDSIPAPSAKPVLKPASTQPAGGSAEAQPVVAQSSDKSVVQAVATVPAPRVTLAPTKKAADRKEPVEQVAFASTMVVDPEAGSTDGPKMDQNSPNGTDGELVLAPPGALANGVDPADNVPIQLHFDELDVRKALEMLSRESPLNILVSPGVKGRVTADLKGVTYEQALQAILKLCNLTSRREKDIIYVYTQEELGQMNQISSNGILGTRVYRLNYVRSEDIANMIRPFLSEQAKLSSTPPSQVGISEGGAAGNGGSGGGSSGGSGGGSSGGGSGGGSGGSGGAGGGGSGGGAAGMLAGMMGGGGGGGGQSGGGGGSSGSPTGGDAMAGGDFVVVQDTEQNLVMIDRLIAQLDVQPVQVLIEAVIMTVTRTSNRDLGINYAVLDGAGRTLATVGSGAAINAAAGFDPSQVLTAGSPLRTLGATLVTQGGKLAGDSNSGFAANSGGIKFGFVDDNLTGFIKALETIGETDILASPRLLVLNKQRAELQLGDRLGFRTLTQSQTSTIQKVEFMNVGTQLFIRPFISSDGMVRMEIHPERSEGQIVDNIPQTRTSQLTTNVMVPDGSTIVIGGLMETVDSTQTQGIPGLSRLPWLGALFRDRSQQSSKKELIVLLTPRIWKPNNEMLPVCPPPTSLLIPTVDGAQAYPQSNIAPTAAPPEPMVNQ